MISSIISIVANGLAVLKKLLPSWEWKGGQASAEAKAAKEAQGAHDRMEDVPAPSRRNILERLRKRRF